MVYVGPTNGNAYAVRLPGQVAAINRPAVGELHPNYTLHPHRDKRP
jgi:hypothetical protein